MQSILSLSTRDASSGIVGTCPVRVTDLEEIMSLWRTKSIEDSLADSHLEHRSLKRTLGTWDLMVMGVAVAVGAGIFSVGARAAGDYAGPSVSLAFVLAAVTCA